MQRFPFALASASALILAQASAAQDRPIDTVIVTASPIAGDRDRFATIVEKVDRADILKSGGANLADALSATPGVASTSFAAGAGRPVIRGFDANRVRLLEDGIGSFDVSEVGPDHGVPIDPLAAQDIEVVRGAATLRYGSQAIGGVVNAINNRVPTTLAGAPLSGEASGAYATNASVGEGSLLGDARLGSIALHADGFTRHTSDYDTPLGPLANSFFRGDGYSAGASYFFSPQSRVGAAYIHYDAKYGIPAEEAYIDMKQDKGLIRSSFAVDMRVLQTITLDGGYADYTHSEIDPSSGVPVIGSTFNDTEWDLRGEAVFGAIRFLSASALGVQFQHRDFSALGEGADFMLPTITRSTAGFGFAEVPVGDALQLQLGLRIENVEAEGTPISGTLTVLEFAPVSGSAGLLFEASDSLKLGLTFSSAARAPAITELFAIGPHEGTGTFETGDPTLGIERANSLEGTVRVRLPRFDLEASLWGAQFSDYIYGNLTGQTCDEMGACFPDDLQEFKELFYQAADAAFWGMEAKATLALWQVTDGNLDLDFLADYVRAEFDGGGNVPRVPPYRVGGGLSWQGDVIDAGFLLLHVGRQDEISTGETPTESYVALNGHVALRPFGESGPELSILGRNLTDDVQRNHISFNKEEVVLPGRNVRFVLRVPF